MEVVVQINLAPITIRVNTAPVKSIDITTADIEANLIHQIVADVDDVQSAVVLRPHHIGPSHLRDSGTGYTADETTKQER